MMKPLWRKNIHQSPLSRWTQLENCQKRPQIWSRNIERSMLKRTMLERSKNWEERQTFLHGITVVIDGQSAVTHRDIKTKIEALGGTYPIQFLNCISWHRARVGATWTADALLICSSNTEVFRKVTALGGVVVSEDWVNDCYDHQTKLATKSYRFSCAEPQPAPKQFALPLPNFFESMKIAIKLTSPVLADISVFLHRLNEKDICRYIVAYPTKCPLFYLYRIGTVGPSFQMCRMQPTSFVTNTTRYQLLGYVSLVQGPSSNCWQQASQGDLFRMGMEINQ